MLVAMDGPTCKTRQQIFSRHPRSQTPTTQKPPRRKPNPTKQSHAGLHFSSSSRKSSSASPNCSLFTNRAARSCMLLKVSGWESPGLARPWTGHRGHEKVVALHAAVAAAANQVLVQSKMHTSICQRLE